MRNGLKDRRRNLCHGRAGGTRGVSRAAWGVGILVAGAALICLRLPSDWIDLAGLAVAAMTSGAGRADHRPGPDVRKLRKAARSARRRIPRDGA